MSAARWIEVLGLVPHPEGGYFRETWREGDGAARGAGTAIYFLLEAGQRSHWHRVDAAEIWHFHGGAPLELETSSSDHGPIVRRLLGTNLEKDERPQLIVGPGEWQAARSLGDYSLVGCTVSPAFSFDKFELAPPGWRPGAS